MVQRNNNSTFLPRKLHETRLMAEGVRRREISEGKKRGGSPPPLFPGRTDHRLAFRRPTVHGTRFPPLPLALFDAASVSPLQSPSLPLVKSLSPPLSSPSLLRITTPLHVCAASARRKERQGAPISRRGGLSFRPPLVCVDSSSRGGKGRGRKWVPPSLVLAA